VGPTSIVVAFRIPLAATSPGGEYLARARALCANAESLGARLVAWSATLIAMAWDLDGAEAAIAVACGIRTECASLEQAWACGVAQGVLERFAKEGQRMDLAWGEPLLVAASLARIARPGEVLIDGDVAPIRSGSLALTGSRSASDGGRRVRGWQLDLERPWREVRSDKLVPHAEEPELEELASADVVDLVESAPKDLARLEQERRQAESKPPAERCRASVALAMALAAVGRPEETLIEALAALARAQEADDPKAQAACYALLAKLYAAVGKIDAASELRTLASAAASPHP
jgi:hypothetical protein